MKRKIRRRIATFCPDDNTGYKYIVRYGYVRIRYKCGYTGIHFCH